MRKTKKTKEIKALDPVELELLEKRKQEIENELSQINVKLKDNLEDKFRTTVINIRTQITEYLRQASVAIDKAQRLSEETGVPFASTISHFYRERHYFPESFNAKWGELDVFDERTDLYEEFDLYDTGGGWQAWSSSSLSC